MKFTFKSAAVFFITSSVALAQMTKEEFIKSVEGSTPKRGGIKIVSIAKMNMTESMRNEALAQLAQQEQKGYSDDDSPEAKYLLSLSTNAPYKIAAGENNTSPYDTHLKQNLSDIQLAFSYKGKTTAIDPKNIIGFAAAAGTWIGGWTGLVEYFKDQHIGTCAFTLYNLEKTAGSVFVAAEGVRYDVNNKPTSIEVRGSKNSGFYYAVRWYDPSFVHELECASTSFDKYRTTKMLALAKQIDG